MGEHNLNWRDVLAAGKEASEDALYDDLITRHTKPLREAQLVARWKRIAYASMIMAVSFLVAAIWIAAAATR